MVVVGSTYVCDRKLVSTSTEYGGTKAVLY